MAHLDGSILGQGPPQRPGLSNTGGAMERGPQSKRLWIVLGFTAVFMVAEVVGGVLSNSLALLADSGHMLADVGALALSLIAMRLALNPPSAERTFGYVRMEILAALVNGATLLFISGWIVWEAWGRLGAPQEVDGPLMMAVAGVGLIVNLVGASLLHTHAHENLNVRGAYLHVLGDLLGSIGAIGAGALILLTGWTPIDAIVSVVIAGLILLGSWRLVKEATGVLLEMVPPHVDMAGVLEDLRSIPNVHNVHDLHVWTLTSGFVALSGHAVLDDPIHHQRVLDEIRDRMELRGIGHVTFQLEPERLHQIAPPHQAGDGVG
jgi:cobalt-zinc-cadmium efflux system protein